MVKINPTIEDCNQDSPFFAFRKRNPDGTPRTGTGWMEVMGSMLPYLNDQKTWEVVFYQRGDRLPD